MSKQYLDKKDVLNLVYTQQADRMAEEYAKLKAEVDELKSQPDPLTAYLYAAELAKKDMTRLKAEVERLKQLLSA